MPLFAICESFKGVTLTPPNVGSDIIRFRVEIDDGFFARETIGLIEGVDHILTVFEKLKTASFEKRVTVHLFKDNDFTGRTSDLGVRSITFDQADDGIQLAEWSTGGELYRLTYFIEIRDE